MHGVQSSRTGVKEGARPPACSDTATDSPTPDRLTAQKLGRRGGGPHAGAVLEGGLSGAGRAGGRWRDNAQHGGRGRAGKEDGEQAKTILNLGSHTASPCALLGPRPPRTSSESGQRTGRTRWGCGWEREPSPALFHRKWCERTETVWVEELVSAPLEDLVPCTSLYHHLRLGWRLGPTLRRQGSLTSDPRLCPIYWPLETRPVAQTRTVPAVSLNECCAKGWGHSWWDGSSQACSLCPSQRAPSSGSTPTLATLQPLAGVWGQLPHPSATCATWSGVHYRTFDGRHFHFLGHCTYLLAGAADSSWAVHLLPRGHCPQPERCQLVRVMMGPEEALIQGGNVSVNGVPVSNEEPQLLHGMSLQWQGDWLVLEGGLGATVRLDRAGSVSISLDPGLQGQTRGLCGLYNNRPEDDFLVPGGGLAALAATFADAWRLPDSEPRCADATDATLGCGGPLEDSEETARVRAEAQDVCHLLLSSPFEECHVQVAPTEYHEACLYAYCGGTAESRQVGQQESVCTTLASYARHCAQQGIYVHWRRPGLCEHRCPGGQLYSDCMSSCPPSCSAVGEGREASCREECVSGCECPPGLYWDGALCMSAAQCPCYHRRQRYAPGGIVYQQCNPCVCQDGRWHCAQAPCPAKCAVGADGHYLTFDGRRFSFWGSEGCRYVLVQDHTKGQLLVELGHGACESGSCLHAIYVTLGGTYVQLKDSGTVLVDGQEVPVPWLGSQNLSVSRASSSFLLLRWPGAQVLWEVSHPSTTITLEPHYAHQVHGLCGTFTWNQQDDFLTPAGDVETSIQAFTSKFQVASMGKCTPGSMVPLHPCSIHTQRRPFAEAACMVLQGQAFQECHQLVEREPYWLRCLATMCGCDLDRDCLCPLLSAYARHCAQEGVSLSWRSQALCPVTCPGGQEHQECAPPCGRNCGEPEDCVGLGGCVSGCTCPPGLLWDPAGQCVPPSQCPCQLGVLRHAPGSSTTQDCNHCICQERGLWKCTSYHCPHQKALCPRGLIHIPGACLLTCDSPSANHNCPMGNTEGCVCPPGTLLLGEHCVASEQCPCRHSGQWYPPNATIQEDCNICVCKGQRWHCTEQQCGGHCQASGAPHYVTFDGLAFTFPGACEYLLVRDTSGRFSVSVQNLPCGDSGLTCTKTLKLQLEGTIMHLLRGRAVTVNGVPISLPKVYKGPGLSLRHAGLFLVLRTRLGFILLWDGGTRVLVYLPPQFRGHVEGLCGDFDGNASNDLRSRQGVLEPTAELAAHSWRLQPLCPEPGDLPHPCTVNAHRAAWARARCSTMLQPLFASCHVEVPPQTHYERCVHDACGCDSGGDCECLCSAIAAYADECARHGHRLRWRSQELCPLQCEGGQHYDTCGPTCPPTCRDQTPEPGWHCQVAACVEGCFCPEGTVLHGSTCLEPTSCPCEWGGSFFPPGTVLQQDCGNCSCQDSQWSCKNSRCEEQTPGCAEGETTCQGNGHCVPLGWLCDNQDDCGDGSDEEGCATTDCGEGQFSCTSGQCLPMALHCDGQDDCADGADEKGCPCPHESLACADGHCLPLPLLCDGHPDCPDAADEESCLGSTNCTLGEVSCGDDSCIGAFKLCDGVWDCRDGVDEGPGHCPLPALPTPPLYSLEIAPALAGSLGPSEVPTALACSPTEFACGSSECVPRGWRCDHDEDCADGSDEHNCESTQLPLCPGLFACGLDPELCLPPDWLCDGTQDCPRGEDELDCEELPLLGIPNRTREPCPEYSCPDGTCIRFQLVCDGRPDCELVAGSGPSPEEQGCGTWGPWSPWSLCSQTCGPGVQDRSRRCVPTSSLVLQHCLGPEHQSQVCFSVACPVDGAWSPWSAWSPCLQPCRGTTTRQRSCHPPQNGGRSCTMMPGEPHSTHQTKLCTQDGCSNTTCPEDLVLWPCAPCPLTCEDVSSQGSCPLDQPCSPGCWCSEGQVLGSEGRCVWPQHCPCLVDGVHYWAGQHIEANCQHCICQDGRPQNCQPSQDCSVNCGWSAWSTWARCLGPCGSHSVQWSFRSPTNPQHSGRGSQCRGIHRKARRCQTEPCGVCEWQGRTFRVGQRWRRGLCEVCQCLYNGTMGCSLYCPLGGCPQGWVLVEGVGSRCCHCVLMLPGGKQTAPPPATLASAPPPSPQMRPSLAIYLLPPPGDSCYSPLVLTGRPQGVLQVLSQQLELAAQATFLGVSSEGSPEGNQAGLHILPRSLQLDLQQPRNLTGVLVQGVEVAAEVSLQFSADGLHWLEDREVLGGLLFRLQVQGCPLAYPESGDRQSPAKWIFSRMVQARHVRVQLRDPQPGVSVLLQLLGCEPGPKSSSGAGPRCDSGECVPKGAECDGAEDCVGDLDKERCEPAQNSAGRLHPTTGTSGPPFTQPGEMSGHGVPWPEECSLGQEDCKVLGCVKLEQLCDGQEDCLDGSDTVVSKTGVYCCWDSGESWARRVPGHHFWPYMDGLKRPQVSRTSAVPFLVPITALPGRPASCSPQQLRCASGECLSSLRRCDLQPDCLDGSDEHDCVDCVLAPWSAWSHCSRSCGPGVTVQLRQTLRHPLPGGSCVLDRIRSQSCFLQACPVPGAWTVWEAWGPCSVSCGGGHQTRRRSCGDPPPKNNGAPCPGASQETTLCSLQPCGDGTDCGPGLVHVNAELCQKGLIPPCPASCLDPEANKSCSGHCLEGCRCPPGLLLYEATCLLPSQCPCMVDEELKLPGRPFLLDNCSLCICEEGALRCESRDCPVPCSWSAWSTWGPCDHSCGSGVRARFRSPSNPPAANGGTPCDGDTQELQACYTECGSEVQGWTPWTPWSPCSKTCLLPGEQPDWRRRSRLCLGPGQAFCLGEDAQEEPCRPQGCPVPSAWGPWAPWSTCLVPCDGGIRTRGRSCFGTTPRASECQGPHSQTQDCNTQPCSAHCPWDMVFRSEEQCLLEGGPCSRLCTAWSPGVECTGFCTPGCACPPGRFLHAARCLLRHQCPCQWHGQLYQPGAMTRPDSCNNCTCVSGEMKCTSQPCPVTCSWSPWTFWTACSRSCDVGIRWRFRADTAPPAAFGGAECHGPSMETEFCSLQPCWGPGQEWGPWSPCSVPCGGGYRNRTQGSGPHSPLDFSTCGLQPCSGPVPGVCYGDQQWMDCAPGPASCAELGAPKAANRLCQPGCYCPPGTLLLNNVCVPTHDCPCVHEGRLHAPGSTVLRRCENCTCLSGLVTSCKSRPCAEALPSWSPWTPWSECSASCGPAWRHRHRFCPGVPSALQSLVPRPSTSPCRGPEAEEKPCDQPDCDRAGGWGPWGPWSHCSRSCGVGLRVRTRACDNPLPQGLGDYCEGPGAQAEACQDQLCEVADCTAVQGTEYSLCGPPCPRSCDDLVLCIWHCQPGCYCPPGQVLSSDGVTCVQPGHCSCLNMLTGERHHAQARLAQADGCNYCTCLEGKFNCTDLPCPVSGGWCPWSEWTPCSLPCRGQRRTRSRACACPSPQHGGTPCPGDTGAHQEQESCPSAEPCPEDGAWSPWGSWSPCDMCGGQSHRSRTCTQPPPPEGGRPCAGAHRQSRPCRDNASPCTDCEGGQNLVPCGRFCPRSCQDLSPGSECQPGSTSCQPGCGCPSGQLVQDGLCVPPSLCRCQFQPGAMGIPENHSRLAGPGFSSWENLDPGEVVMGPCDTCTCVAGSLLCKDVPGCPGPGVWTSWGPWEGCSMSCGGGEQLRARHCGRPPCPGPARQSRTCHTQVCKEAGCLAGRLYRECKPGEGCPFSCAHITQKVGCYSEGCEEGCHCPLGTFQHRLACVQECPCELTASLLQELRALSSDPGAQLLLLGEEGQPLGPRDDLGSGQTLHVGCNHCSCVNGTLTCSQDNCPTASSFGAWSAWGPCSVSCGGLGTRSRSRLCVSPSLQGQDCLGPRQDLSTCSSPDCPGVEVKPTTGIPAAWGPWSSWSSCSRSCTDPTRPAWRHRARLCWANCTRADAMQERPCNLPSCTGPLLCPGPGCMAGNCSWTAWGPWEPCSRSCGVGQQRRLRAYWPPGPGGHWCPDILSAYQERRFCNLRACPVSGGWSRWSPWSLCDRSCGGGRSLRSRSCSSPPPKNGGAPCVGEQHHTRPCNPMPCEDGCPAGMEVVVCANRCPRQCSDFQEGTVCQDQEACQHGCRCPEGSLEQGGHCVPISHCECTDAQGQVWAPGSKRQEACSTCTCQEGRLSCTTQPCPPPAHCAWSGWSAWSTCSHSCGPGGQQSRFRSSTSGSWAPECREEQSQSQPCVQSPCPPLCVQNSRLRTLGDHWLQESCEQCSCTPEGVMCDDTGCAASDAWTSWSSWSSCPVSCGGSSQVRTRACTSSASIPGGRPCSGPDSEVQSCGQQPCPGLPEVCSWGPWGLCSQSCGPGLASRSGVCPCLLSEAHPTCNGTFLHLDTRACYYRPCPEACIWSSWSSWTRCSCRVPVQQRYRHQEPAPGALEDVPCTQLNSHFRPCPLSTCSEDSCTPPFEFRACGSPCTALCATRLQGQLCQDLPPCQSGCYCPEGLLEQAGACVPLEQCRCVHIPGGAPGLALAPGGRLWLGCKECECQRGELQCVVEGCRGLLPLSGWSEWTPCGPCLPPSALAPASRTALQGYWAQDPTLAPQLASEQHRYRLCLDPETGRHWAGDPQLCTAPLSQQRLCPDPQACWDPCQWSPWGAWSPCQLPCGGGFRLRWRDAGSTPGEGCRGPWAQTEGCNLAPCAGVSCATHGAEFSLGCANHCPRACADLWDQVQCLQGPCRPGCRCPTGQLLQDGHCVPISSCRCSLPGHNASRELSPAEIWQLDCQNWYWIAACPPGEVWQVVAPGGPRLCEPTCREVNGTDTLRSSCSMVRAGCVCQQGHFRSQEGTCVLPHECECWHHGRPHQPASEWQEGCESCRCLSGRNVCSQHCPLHTCGQNELNTQEPGTCCPTCQQPTLEGLGASCQHFTEKRNLTKGPCHLDQVEVSYCRGHCPSSTDVIPEEPYLQSRCECCSYQLDPDSPVRVLGLHCPGGRVEPVVLPAILSCHCSACPGEGEVISQSAEGTFMTVPVGMEKTKPVIL
ncbi:PREDICTED: SCO-spondin [Elephantulus edwardii]|uniref:SCO-spondin n=1 Tax=Elephantulus edwardii TaxID=28737 RepID=UPI0003F0EE96|nr:PREDICTED: SCO-spondin [Elephantulus edwardii]